MKFAEGLKFVDGISIVTATGMRPRQLALCAEYVKRQTWPGPIQWIVVDDGEVASDVDTSGFPENFTVTVIRPTPFWKSGDNTLGRNILAALPEVAHDALFFFEDDDWYAEDFCEDMLRYVGVEDVICGEIFARYYHLPSGKFRTFDNSNHASLCQTCIFRPAFLHLAVICGTQGSSFIDVRLWGNGGLLRVLHRGEKCVGMKGLPGRPGIGIGHDPSLGGDWETDGDGAVLARWLGSDAKRYEAFQATSPTGGNGVKEVPLPNDPRAREGGKIPLRIDDFSAPAQTEFEEFYWMGQKRYRCNQTWESGEVCQFDTYSLDIMADHLRAPHTLTGKPSATASRKRVSSILNSDGKNFVVDETPPPEFRDYAFKKE